MRSFTAKSPPLWPFSSMLRSLLRIFERNQFLPHVFVWFPIRHQPTCDLDLVHRQRSVTEGADIFGARPAKQNMRPVASEDRHPQPAQARPAAIALIVNH